MTFSCINSSYPSDELTLGKIWEILKPLGKAGELLSTASPLTDFVYTESKYFSYLEYQQYERHTLRSDEQKRFDRSFADQMKHAGGPEGYRKKLVGYYQQFGLASGPESASILIEQACKHVRNAKRVGGQSI